MVTGGRSIPATWNQPPATQRNRRRKTGGGLIQLSGTRRSGSASGPRRVSRRDTFPTLKRIHQISVRVRSGLGAPRQGKQASQGRIHDKFAVSSLPCEGPINPTVARFDSTRCARELPAVHRGTSPPRRERPEVEPGFGKLRWKPLWRQCYDLVINPGFMGSLWGERTWGQGSPCKITSELCSPLCWRR